MGVVGLLRVTLGWGRSLADGGSAGLQGRYSSVPIRGRFSINRGGKEMPDFLNPFSGMAPDRKMTQAEAMRLRGWV